LAPTDQDAEVEHLRSEQEALRQALGRRTYDQITRLDASEASNLRYAVNSFLSGIRASRGRFTETWRGRFPARRAREIIRRDGLNPA
jgi:hypothetical protein